MVGTTLKKSSNTKKKKNTRIIFWFVECDGLLFVCVKLAGVGLNVFECAGKSESHPG